MKLVEQVRKPEAAAKFDVVEAGISRLRAALNACEVTSEELVRLYLERI